jgi:2-polyprenyl-3-methyl-5-hydroxy-6-metoxy-1,4-benzoquinol methylase
MFATPILFLIFNRPNTTSLVFDAIKLVKPRMLFVAADGPRENNIGEFDLCQKVRELVVENIDWDCEVKTLFREKNLGCGRAVSEAITWFFSHVEEGIILEDDCLPDSSFFNFCEVLLLKYRDVPQIMHIGGHSLGVHHPFLDNTYFFSAYNHIWGWATWKRAWKFYQFDIDKIDKKIISVNFHYYFKTRNEISYWESIFTKSKNINTWDYQWTFSIWENKGISILPLVNMVKNIGFGTGATNTNSEVLLYKNAPYDSLKIIPDAIKTELILNNDFDMQMSNSIFNINCARSPLTGTDKTQLLEVISTSTIIDKYKKQFNLDVSSYFHNISEIKKFECNESGYKFFYPFNINGDGLFYRHFQKFHWYYMPWKWEHEKVLKLLKTGMNILEVGCGTGAFLKEVRCRIPGINLTGLEINEEAIESAKKEGLLILPQLIQDHAKIYSEKYDLICSFQVLEHIAEVKDFIQAQVTLLKPGGFLIVSVPNNGGFLGDSENTLNIPPHHMGIWDEKSLIKMGKYFNLKHYKTHFEPLQEYHKEYFQNVRHSIVQSYPRILKFFLRIQWIDRMVFSSKYRSFTIQMVWKK